MPKLDLDPFRRCRMRIISTTTTNLRLILIPTGWLLHGKEFVAMCVYSLQSVRSRAAKIGDKLVTKDFRTGTRGFASAEDLTIAVCVLPGTELAFASDVTHFGLAHNAPTASRDPLPLRLLSLIGWVPVKTQYKSAIFRQINKGDARTHHDALEFPD